MVGNTLFAESFLAHFTSLECCGDTTSLGSSPLHRQLLLYIQNKISFYYKESRSFLMSSDSNFKIPIKNVRPMKVFIVERSAGLHLGAKGGDGFFSLSCLACPSFLPEGTTGHLSIAVQISELALLLVDSHWYHHQFLSKGNLPVEQTCPVSILHQTLEKSSSLSAALLSINLATHHYLGFPHLFLSLSILQYTLVSTAGVFCCVVNGCVLNWRKQHRPPKYFFKPDNSVVCFLKC